MYRKYAFKKVKGMIYFIAETLKRADSLDHHPEMTISGKEIEVVLTTHDINDISNLDIKMSKYMSETFDDIHYIG